MPNPENITGKKHSNGRLFQQGDKQREIARKGGKVSAAKRAQRKALREELLDLLSVVSTGSDGKQHTTNEAVSLALIKQALHGNVKAYEIIRDTIGEKPTETINVTAADFSALDAVVWGKDE